MSSSREKIVKALNPLGAIGCEIVAFVLIANSKWFKSLSPKGSYACKVIAPLYLISTIVAAVLAYCNPWPQRMMTGLKMKFFIQSLFCGAIIFLTYEFGEHNSDYYLASAFVCAAFHFHLGAHSFRCLEDYGLAQGLITVAVTAGMHLAKEWPMQFVPLLVGVILSALYNLILNREANNEPGRNARGHATSDTAIRDLEEGTLARPQIMRELLGHLIPSTSYTRSQRVQVQDLSVPREANNEDDEHARPNQSASEEVLGAREQTIIELQGLLRPSNPDIQPQGAQADSDDDREPLLEQDSEGMSDDTYHTYGNSTPSPGYPVYGGYSGYDEDLERAEREYNDKIAEGKVKVP